MAIRDSVLHYVVRSVVLCLVLVVNCRAGLRVKLSPSLASPQPVGTFVTWTATATDSSSGTLNYRFEVGDPATPFAIARDFNLQNTFNWLPSFVEGPYQIRVTVRNCTTNETLQQTIAFVVSSRVTGLQAVVSPTVHPLVALFSAPTCPSNTSIRVTFQVRADGATPDTTPWSPCHAGSENFLIAGMLPDTTYSLRYQLASNGTVKPNPSTLLFHTGKVAAALPVPPVSILTPPTSQADVTDKITLMGFSAQAGPIALDLNAAIVWYYPSSSVAQFVRPLAGGTMLTIENGHGTGVGVWGDQTLQQLLREVDLTGTVIRETNVDRINEQLLPLGHLPVSRFDHDAIRLADGSTIALCDDQKIFPAGTQGSAVPIDLIGAVLVRLDSNFQVTWTWDSFDHPGPTQLDPNRAAPRGETCPVTIPGDIAGCPPVLLLPTAQDWLHANSVQYVLADKSLLLSLRDQDWVIKIDYDDASGSGNLFWRLGLGGDFSIISSDPYPWFSGQHDAAYEDGGNRYISLYDDGNSRNAEQGGDSRGQLLNVDQSTMTVTLAINENLGLYTPSVGSAQLLPNHNFFAFAANNFGSSPYSQGIELDHTGADAFRIQGNAPGYRGWRMPTLYTPPPS